MTISPRGGTIYSLSYNQSHTHKITLGYPEKQSMHLCGLLSELSPLSSSCNQPWSSWHTLKVSKTPRQKSSGSELARNNKLFHSTPVTCSGTWTVLEKDPAQTTKASSAEMPPCERYQPNLEHDQQPPDVIVVCMFSFRFLGLFFRFLA